MGGMEKVFVLPHNCTHIKIARPKVRINREFVQWVELFSFVSLTWGLEKFVGRVLGLLTCMMQCHRFDPSLGKMFPVEWIFLLELAWVLAPFPKNSFEWEYKLRSSLCTHAFYRSDSKDPDIHVLDGWMLATKTHPACTIHKDGMWLPQRLD